MKNFGKKMKRENFLKSVWLEEGEKKNVMGSKYFHSEPTKMWRKLGKRVCAICYMDKNGPVAFLGNNGSLFFLFLIFLSFAFLGHFALFLGGAMLALAFLFSFFFFGQTLNLFFFIFFSLGYLLLLLLFSFDFLGRGVIVICFFVFILFFFSCLIGRDFFFS